MKNLTCLLLFLNIATVSAAAEPNILYIFTDDQSRRSVSSYPEAHSWVRTPHIDSLAKSGVRFTHCYTGAWCQPSRLSVLTGLLQHRHQSFKVVRYPMAAYDSKRLPFWPAYFRKEGYFTACIGKWHLGEDTGHGRDWDYSVIWDRGGPKKNSYAYYHDQLVRRNGGERELLEGYSTDNYTKLAVEFVKDKQRKNQPWFLWLCYGGVHGPYTPADRHSEVYPSVKVNVPDDIYGPRPRKPVFMKNYGVWEDKDGVPMKGKTTLDAAVSKYNRAVKSIDEGVGKLMAALKETGQLENTIVIFTSDQGFAWGQHGFARKWAPYDANLTAPLILSQPGKIPDGKVCGEPVTGVDITSTIHGFAGIKPRWKMHGRDFSQLAFDPDGEPLGQPMVLMNSIQEYGERFTTALKEKKFKLLHKDSLSAWIMMRDRKYKYIRYVGGKYREELYDLEDDPDELHNLSVSKEHQRRLSSYRAKLIDELKKQDADFLEVLPDVKIEVFD